MMSMVSPLRSTMMSICPSRSHAWYADVVISSHLATILYWLSEYIILFYIDYIVDSKGSHTVDCAV
jgi:hypothetical protein